MPRLPGYWVHLLSTETMQVELHANHLSRLQKLPVMAEWDDFRKNLRVCMNQKKIPGKPVCDRCEKCLNTSLVLELWGLREQFPDFSRPFTAFKFARMCWNSVALKDYRVLIIDQAKKIRRYDLILLYWLILPFNQAKMYLRKRLVALLPPDMRYALKNIVYRYQRLEK
ncbi:MAG: hypothetical protein MUO76_11040 [Anaerolineaceae bacterium]|nr:hypothetical protein [Anaerolineaceae bacterium]